ncbi:hypothetical protein GGX14DRAFT_580920 [Mycena pura]|uniref:BZIP domain-containing protein n=1 Tax=Mycena pura TaxID=153505 RepID=A0AAD6UJX8_9AGAR|nr:hypothetical protein GGX14DRAFT_580920 [Mycena pura]
MDHLDSSQKGPMLCDICYDFYANKVSTWRVEGAQHHWTSSRTGIKLTLVEGIESARIVDYDTLQDVELSMTTSILINSNNEMFHRQGRNSQRHALSAKRSRESAKLGERKAALQAQMNDEKAKLDATKAEYKALGSGGSRSTTSSSRNRVDTVIVSASSSGCVKTALLPKRVKALAPLTAVTLTRDDAAVPRPATVPVDTPAAVPRPAAVPVDTPAVGSPEISIPSGPENCSDLAAWDPLPFSASSYSSYETVHSTFDPSTIESDFVFGGSVYDYGDLSMFSLPSNTAFPAEFEAPESHSTPMQSLDADFVLPRFSQQPDLPILPPPPASSPPHPEPVDSAVSTPPPPKNIDLELDSRNVVQGVDVDTFVASS